MGLRAVVFDYGMVLTGPQDPQSHASLLRLTGLPLDRFETLYWEDRHAYDEGKLTGLEFWRRLLVKIGSSSASPALVEELTYVDGRMWTTQNPAMLTWHAELKRRGLKTGILSNMGDSVLASVQKDFAWLKDFDVLVWSFQLRMAKPDPAIYMQTLKELGTSPQETLFLDDKLVNIEAARALGMQAIQFSTVEQLRVDLVAAGLENELPRP